MENLTVGQPLPSLLDSAAFEEKRFPFPSIGPSGGYPSSALSAQLDVTKRWPVPLVSSMLISHCWTLLAWKRTRLDILASSGSSRIPQIGLQGYFMADDKTQLQVGMSAREAITGQIQLHRTMGAHTVGVSLESSRSSDAIGSATPVASLLYSGSIFPNSSTAYAGLHLTGSGVDYSWGVVSAPQGANGFRIRLSVDGAMSVPRPVFTLSCPINGTKRLYTKLGLDSLESGVSVQPQPDLRLNVGIRSDTRGISICFRLQYHLFNVSIPCLIHNDPQDLRSVVFCISIPVALWGLWVTVPLLAHKRRKMAADRSLYSHQQLALKIDSLRRCRQAALDQQQAMATEAEGKYQHELENQGLVIERGTFFIDDVDALRAEKAVARGPEYSSRFDVTIPLRFWVNNSKLALETFPKRSMLGFYCPFGPAVKKARPLLKIDYAYQGKSYCCTVAELEPVNLPDSRHLRM